MHGDIDADLHGAARALSDVSRRSAL
jgi:hypothetical protein